MTNQKQVQKSETKQPLFRTKGNQLPMILTNTDQAIDILEKKYAVPAYIVFIEIVALLGSLAFCKLGGYGVIRSLLEAHLSAWCVLVPVDIYLGKFFHNKKKNKKSHK